MTSSASAPGGRWKGASRPWHSRACRPGTQSLTLGVQRRTPVVLGMAMMVLGIYLAFPILVSVSCGLTLRVEDH